MTRDEAVEKIQLAGFHAFKRDWRLGKTVGCGKPTADNEEIPRRDTLVYLFPTSNGWGVQASGILGKTDYNQCLTLEDASDVAIGLLSSPYLPFNPEELKITIARCANGRDRSWIEHTPTGLQRVLFEPEDDSRKEFMTKEQALQEIAFELALNHCPNS